MVSEEPVKKKIPSSLLRDIPGWKDAPVPICMFGDLRALSWCCKPGSSLTFGFKCLRDEKLKEIGLSSEEFLRIKEEFSEKHGWESDFTCFGNFSYCCMRNGGCSRRDAGFADKYPDQTIEESKEKYYALKKELANIILKAAKNQSLVKDYIEFNK
jgi:predicted metal-binding transcription factor (methanogenesis marker protein 9)